MIVRKNADQVCHGIHGRNYKKNLLSLILNLLRSTSHYLIFLFISFRKLSRISNDDTLLCDETLQFEFHKDDITTTSLRFLLFCIDRTGIQDLISEALIRFTPSMISNFQQIIQFKDLPQV